MHCPLCKKGSKRFFSIPDYPVFANALDGAGPDPLYLFEVLFCEPCAFGFQPNPPPAETLYTRVRAPSGVSKVWRDHYEALAAFAEKHLEGDASRVLDVGAGHGFLSELLLQKKFEVEALDLNPGEKLKSLGIPVYQKFFGKGFTATKKYNAVLLSHVAEHVNDLEGFLKEAVAALNPSGRLIFSVPDVAGGMQNNDLSLFIPEHTWYFSERALEKILKSFGFVAEAVKPYNDHSLFISARKGSENGRWRERPLLKELNALLEKYWEHYQKSLRRVSEIVAQARARVVFFGAHSMTLHLAVPLQLWKQKKSFVLIDNDPLKRGLRLSGTPWTVVNPEVAGLNPQDIVIIPRSSYAAEMAEQVTQLGAPSVVI